MAEKVTQTNTEDNFLDDVANAVMSDSGDFFENLDQSVNGVIADPGTGAPQDNRVTQDLSTEAEKPQDSVNPDSERTKTFIKASNQIRRGQGLFKKLTEKQRIVQHNNLTTLAEEFNKTKTFDPKVNEYFGINAEKAFVEAQTKQGEQMWKDIGAAPTFKLSREKLVDQFKGLPETEVNRIMKLPVEEQKLEITRLNELSDHAWIKGKPHAEGGLIPGYATGGVSELFNEKTPREGFHEGSLRHQKQHDYEALEKKGNIFRYLMMAGDRAKRAAPENPVNVFFSKKDEKGNPLWSYNQKTDDFESFMKERFMYGEHKEPLISIGDSELDKKINNWVKEKFLKLVGKEDVPEEFATGGVSNLFRKK